MSTIKILIVEDEAVTRGHLEDIVTGAGYELVGSTAKGEEALSLASKTEPDVVLMDIYLKGALDGITAASMLRSAQKGAVVFLTAFADDRTVTRARAVEPYGYVCKPISERELLANVQIAYQKRKHEILRESYRELLDLYREIERQNERQKLNAERDRISNSVKSEFLRILSHDLKTPLSHILSPLEIIATSKVVEGQEPTRTLLTIAQTATVRLNRYIDDLLDLASIRFNRVALNEEVFDPGAVIREVFFDFMSQAAEKQCRLIDDATSSGPLPLVKGDSGRLRQVLANLLSNAIEYGPVGGDVKATAEVSDADRTLMIEISDQGEGIQESWSHRLFQAFDRLGREAGPIEGLGIGLALSKELMKRMGGAIGYRKGETGGAIFWISLPLSGPSEPQDPGRSR